jgi:hypothetical protein
MKDVQDIGASPNLRSLARSEPGQVVLVLQGGGALGSYQAGVYQRLHRALVARRTGEKKGAAGRSPRHQKRPWAAT